MALGVAAVVRIRIRFVAQNQPAQLIDLDYSTCTRELSGGDLSTVESWTKNGNYQDMRAGDEFVVVYSTDSDLSAVTNQAFANQAGSTVLGWQPATFWSYYD